jgi:hypothetical protein
MANSNVIAALFGGTKRNTILTQTATPGTETEFQVGGDFANAIAIIGIPSQNSILGVQTTYDQSTNPAILGGGFTAANARGHQPINNQVFDNSHPFLLRLCGTYTPTNGLSPVSITFRIYNGTSKAGTLIATAATTNIITSGPTFGVVVEAQLHWDSISQSLRGSYYYDVSPTYQTYSATTPSSAASVASLMFCASAQWSGSGGGGSVAVSEFSLTQL